METDRVGRLEGLSEKIFLDRYAWKNADTSNDEGWRYRPCSDER